VDWIDSNGKVCRAMSDALYAAAKVTP